MDAAPTTRTSGTDKLGLATIIAGLCIIVGSVGSELVTDWLWIVMLVGFILLLYSVPRIHRVQSHADGGAGEWGARLVVFGGGIFILLGLIYLVWEVVGTPPEDGPGWANVLWPIGFFSFLIGIVAFAIGTIKARKVAPIGPWLMLIGLVLGVAIDMATGAFFEDDPETTAYGFLIGIPVFGLGLIWIGKELRGGGAPNATTTTP